MAKKFFPWLIIFLGLMLIAQSLFNREGGSTLPMDDIVLRPKQATLPLHEQIILEVINQMDQEVQIPSLCPGQPFRVEHYVNGQWIPVSAEQGRYMSCGDTQQTHSLVKIPEHYQLKPKATLAFDFSPWADQLFSELGHYRISLPVHIAGVDKQFTTELSLDERGFFSSVGFQVFYRPIFNLLSFFTTLFPDHSFGFSIIALTLLIRLLLLVPNQKALKSQRAMMRIQPELDAIKRKHHGDQQKIAAETMELWKKHRVNPVGGCLPLLAQLPVMIALFYVIRGGFTPFLSSYLYPFLNPELLIDVNTHFLGILDLQMINATWLPVVVGLLQFAQMKLTFSRTSGIKTAGVEVVKSTDSDVVNNMQDPLRMMNKTMLYFMPVMMGLMVASVPSGVGLYLVISTIFSVVQQLSVNRSA